MRDEEDKGDAYSEGVYFSVRRPPLEKTGMSFPEAEGSDRPAIPGGLIAGVDGGGWEKKRTKVSGVGLVGSIDISKAACIVFLCR